jgi:pSer/pThr/pTyr-binding forkhead associated (FHA) protein
MWILRAPESPEAGALAFRIGPNAVKTIGRARGVDFVVDAPLVSRVHCRLTTDAGGRLDVEDLKSTNGTFVNDQRVTGPTRLEAGDRLRVGRVELTVERD